MAAVARLALAAFLILSAVARQSLTALVFCVCASAASVSD